MNLSTLMTILPLIMDFLILWLVIYGFIYYFRGTKTPVLLAGLVIILLILSSGAKYFKLEVLHYILDSFLPPILGTAFIVIFQPEIRRSVVDFGKLMGNSVGINRGNMNDKSIRQVVQAALHMSQKRIGAIIVFERTVGINEIVSQSVELDSRIDAPILESIFFPNSPLHDCAVIIRWRTNRIVAARAVLPLADENYLLDGQTFGTRHRAAIGITKESDTVALVVSEETGAISIANHGVLERNLSKEALENKLNELLKPQANNKK